MPTGGAAPLRNTRPSSPARRKTVSIAHDPPSRVRVTSLRPHPERGSRPGPMVGSERVPARRFDRYGIIPAPTKFGWREVPESLSKALRGCTGHCRRRIHSGP